MRPAFSQEDKKLLRKGNKEFRKEAFSDAEINYRKALETNPMNENAVFNLGTSRYKQDNFEAAAKDFSQATEMSKSAMATAEAYYNLGNSLMNQEQYQESVNAFKQALRLNPEDEEARYNLAYAQWKLKEQEQQKQDQDQKQDQQNDQQDQEQQQDKQDQEQQQDQENQDQKQDQQQQNDQQNQQQQQQQKPQMSKEDAERMLQALQNEEKKTLDKINEQKVRAGSSKSLEKDW
ncbi:MAG: tetratricopeptide repeat protein [Bacteroidetes bacterium]|nr:tetratricopeptide repeat protein [Bacteroidota bacterium]MBU1580187.1 tetratricopeptide repeat protein [Bacteroidota bacterium]MBU2557834.1 tetratricopeptide repeat protein [Bacteroidota bacterium]